MVLRATTCFVARFALNRVLMDSMTLHEVAAELDVHYMTVYRYVRLGYLDAYKEGGSWRVRRDDFESFRQPGQETGDDAGTDWGKRLVQRLLAADQAGAWRVIEAALAAGKSVRDVYIDLIIAAMATIGERWAKGKVSVAEEHAATQVMVRIVSRLSSRVARRGVSKGTIVVGTPAVERHVLPLMIAADLIRLEGFEVLDLGSDLPAKSFAETASKQQRLVAVGVSATAPNQADAIRETISELRTAVAVPIFLGGGAIDGPEHAKLLGADFGGPRVSDVIPELLALAG